MRWALIENGVVSEISDIDPADRFHPVLVWVSCSDEIKPGHSYFGGVFTESEENGSSTSKTCTPAQGLVALFVLKNIAEEDVLSAIDRINDPVQKYTARIGYQRATTWERSSPTMQSMAQLLQLSEEDLDALYSYAVTVQV